MFLNDPLNVDFYNKYENNKQLFIIIIINFSFGFRCEIILEIGQN